MEFNAGVLAAWRVGKRTFVIGENTEAFGVCTDLDEMLAWWIRDWQYGDIKGAGLTAARLEALGLKRSADDTWVEGFRINGRIWTASADS